MDNDTTGQLGESAVIFALDSTRYLKTNIVGGKYPIWDGEVLVYDSQDSHSNEHFVGRVPLRRLRCEHENTSSSAEPPKPCAWTLFEELGIGRVEPDEVVMTPRPLGLDRRGGATA